MLYEKGQAFEPFKMLIGAVFALLVLVIILGAVSYFDDLDYQISMNRFSTGLNQAVKLHDGSILTIEELKFPDDTSFSSKGIGNVVGLDEGCIEFIEK